MTSGFESLCPLAPPSSPPMRFVFLGSGLCLQLPSDSASRRTPLLFGLGFRSSQPPEDFHLHVTSRFAFAPRLLSARSWRFAPCLAHKKREAPRERHLPYPLPPLPCPLPFYFFTLNR